MADTADQRQQERDYGFDTLALHGGQEVDSGTTARAVPIYHYTLPKIGVDVKFVDAGDPDNFGSAITDKTKALFAETVSNPALNTLDIEAAAAVAHEAGVPLIIDNTLPSPYLANPLEHGADVVIHSATKFIGGHGTSIGGVIVDGGKFPWDNGRVPGFPQ